MAEQTTNYGLVKPEPDEFYDVSVPNGNMDVIDNKLKELEVSNNAIASTTKLGHVKIGQGLTISPDGTLKAEAQAVPNASTAVAGITKLNDSLISTSTSEAATTNAVKKVNDAKLNKAGDTMTGDLTINKGIPRVYLQVPGVDYTTEFRNNASPTNDFGFDIYRKNIRALHISPSGAVWVRDNAGVEFNLGDLKSSVSNGKSAIASAISDGGVYTSPVETFANMANNIRALYGAGLRLARGSAVGTTRIDVPAGTFGFTPRLVFAQAGVLTAGYFGIYSPPNGVVGGSSAYAFQGAAGRGGQASAAEEIAHNSSVRNGGFSIQVAPSNYYPYPGIAFNWVALG